MSGAVGTGPLLEGGKSGLVEPCPLETSVGERSAYDMRSVDSRRARAHRLTMAAAVVALACLMAPAVVVATTLPPGFVETNIASGFSAPTSFEFAPDGRIFVCQQGGQVRVIDGNGNLLATPFVSLTVDSSGERSLLGLALDPNFATNNFVYLYYTA